MLGKTRRLRRIASGLIVALLFLSLSLFIFGVQPAKAQSRTICINANEALASKSVGDLARTGRIYPVPGQYANFSLSRFSNDGTLVSSGYYNITYRQPDSDYENCINATQDSYSPNLASLSAWQIVNRSNRQVVSQSSSFWSSITYYQFWMSLPLKTGENVTWWSTPRANATITAFETLKLMGQQINCWKTWCNVSGVSPDPFELNETAWFDNSTGECVRMIVYETNEYFELSILNTDIVSNTIYINPDGSITPSYANITTTDNVTYTFTSGNYLPIVVRRSNITIEGAGHTLRSPGFNGFLLSGVRNVTIRNTTITNCHSGVFLYSSSDDVLSYDNFTANTYGIWLGSSSRNVLSHNNVVANYEGVVLDSSSDNNTLVGNKVTANNDDGIILEFSSGNVLSGNLMASNTYNFGVLGSALNDLVNHVDTSNFVDEKPVYYLMHQSNIVISPATCPEGVGYLGLVNCKNVTVQGLTLTKNVVGLTLANTTDSRITNDTVTANRGFGIALWYSSDNNTLSGNNVTASSWYGIWLGSSSGNILSGNNIANNGYGTINGYGIYLNSSSGNRIFHNNFLNNTQQTYVSNSTNTWDDGYPSGGNYWSDYRTKYTNAVENDSSGIWNTPYVIDSSNTDRYPLMGLFHTFPVWPWNGTYYVDVVSNSTLSNFSGGISLENPADKVIRFNVTGTGGTVGFCRIDIPTGFASIGQLGYWSVLVGGALYTNGTIITSGNYTYIYFTYTHSTKIVQITNNYIVPEFQPFMLLPLFMIITLLGAMIFKRKQSVTK